MDFETRSACTIKRGAWMYSKHPTTEMLCLSFLLPGDDPTKPSLFHTGYWKEIQYFETVRKRQVKRTRREWVPAGMLPGSPHTLADLFIYIATGGLIEAHNSFFERCIWEHLATQAPITDEFGCVDYRKGLGAPAIQESQWRCSAAKAAVLTLPRDLAGACRVVFPDRPEFWKDDTGSKTMKRIAKPRPARKGDASGEVRFWEDEESYLRTYDYCNQDVIAQHALSEALPDLTPAEYEVWVADMRANWRGVLLDRELCEAAVAHEAEIKAELNAMFRAATGGAVESATQREKVRTWLAEHGLALPDMQAATIDDAIKSPTFAHLAPEVRRVLPIVREINRTSVAKFARMLTMRDPEDGRMRELLLYHGATTGRFTGRGPQVHNFPRGDLKSWKVTMDEACKDICALNLQQLKAKYSNVLALLSSVARGALIPSKGLEFLIADYAAIEARVVLWLAGEEDALDIFRRKEDLYCDMASTIYRRVITKADEKERKFGKQAILSLGFGVGFLTFVLKLREELQFTVAEVREILQGSYDFYIESVRKSLYPDEKDFEDRDDSALALKAARLAARMRIARIKETGVTPDEIVHEMALGTFVVKMYRERFPRVKELWKTQENAAIEAIRIPGIEVKAGPVTWVQDGRYLFCYLPTGRRLAYVDPFLKPIRTPWGEIKEQVCFWAVPKKNKKGWLPTHSYGASFVENITQAVARDIMARAFVRADKSRMYTPIATVHDEMIVEVPRVVNDGATVSVDGKAPGVHDFETFMSAVPPELAGLPVAAEGGRVQRYRKL